MRLDIRYRMHFDYDHPVWEAQNEIRVRPRDDDRQRVIAYRLTPAPSARVLSFVDYWGTTVDHVGIRQPHLSFEILAEAAVETQDVDPTDASAPIELLRQPGVLDIAGEYLARSPHVEWDDAIRSLTSGAVDGTTTVGEQIERVVQAVRDRLVYEKGSTTIGVTLASLLDNGRGVCQDYAHLTIGMLRSIGIPARYVSGYLFASDETAGENDSEEPVHVLTHAWVEAFSPAGGWVAVDPTNGRPVGRRHVVIGHGRDYDDVAPVRGAYLGDAVPTVDASVEIRRMEPVRVAVTRDRPRRLDEQQMEAHRRQMEQHQQ